MWLVKKMFGRGQTSAAPAGLPLMVDRWKDAPDEYLKLRPRFDDIARILSNRAYSMFNPHGRRAVHIRSEGQGVLLEFWTESGKTLPVHVVYIQCDHAKEIRELFSDPELFPLEVTFRGAGVL